MASNFSVEEIEKHPIAIEAFNYLVGKGLIYPGSQVPGEEVEKALGRQYQSGEKDNWKFLGPFLLLKNRIEAEGYFITQKNMDGPSFRILNTEEMANHASKKLMDSIASNYKIGYIMAAHDISSLSEREKKYHKNVQYQAAQCAILQHKIVIQNSIF